MANRLTNLRLHELSIVRGQGNQPANPEATAEFYKSEPGGETEEGRMAEKKDQQSAPAAAGDKTEKSAVERLGEAFIGVLEKATRTITWRDEATSTMTESVDGPVAMSTEEPKTEKAQAIDADALAKTLGESVQKGLEPVVAKLGELDTRLTKMEKTPSGSKQPNTEVTKSSGIIQVTDNSGSKFPLAVKALREQLGLSPGQALTKAAITTSSFAVGLTEREATEFIDFVVDESRLMRDTRRVDMGARTVKIDKIGLGGKVFRKGTEATDPGETVTVSPSEIQLVAKEIIAIVRISDDTLEDNIEGDRFLDHLLGMVGRAGANELEEALFHGDTAVPDANGIKDRWDGWNKLARAGGAHVIEGAADADRYFPGTNASKASRVIKALPTKYRMDRNRLRWLMHSDILEDYEQALTGTGSGEAFRMITDPNNPRLKRIPVIEMPLLSKTDAFSYSAVNYINGTQIWLTDPRNLIWGVHRNLRIEADRLPRLRATDFVITLRGDAEIENGDAVAIYDHALVQGEAST